MKSTARFFRVFFLPPFSVHTSMRDWLGRAQLPLHGTCSLSGTYSFLRLICYQNKLLTNAKHFDIRMQIEGLEMWVNRVFDAFPEDPS